MSKIVIYEDFNFAGLTREFTSDVPNLSTEGFNDIISSVKVYGRPWVAFHDCFFAGEQYIFEDGEHASVPRNDVISSLKLLADADLSDPHITLFEKPDYQGHSITITGEICLSDTDFKASSHKVGKGVWVIYEHAKRGGAQMVTTAGQAVPNYSMLNNQVGHVRPVK